MTRMKPVYAVSALAVVAALIATVALLRAVRSDAATPASGPTAGLSAPARTDFSPEANEAARVMVEDIGNRPQLDRAGSEFLVNVGEGMPTAERRSLRTLALALLTDFSGRLEDQEAFEASYRAAVAALQDEDQHVRHAGIALARTRAMRDLPVVRDLAARLVNDPDYVVRDFARTVWPDLAPPGTALEPPR